MINSEKHPNCPSDDFSHGEPNGKCWGDGHYLCNGCKYFRADFKGDGWEKRDALIAAQIGMRITSLNSKTTYIL